MKEIPPQFFSKNFSVIPLAPFGSSKNLFYSTGKGLAAETVSPSQFFNRLLALSPETTTVVPSHFFALSEKALFLEKLRESGRAAAIQLELESELEAYFSVVQKTSLPPGSYWQILCFHGPSEKALQFLEQLRKKAIIFEIIYFPFHYGDHRDLDRLRALYPNQLYLGYLPKGHKRDPFYTPVDFMLFRTNYAQGVPLCSFGPARILRSGKEMRLSELLIFWAGSAWIRLRRIYYSPETLVWRVSQVYWVLYNIGCRTYYASLHLSRKTLQWIRHEIQYRVKPWFQYHAKHWIQYKIPHMIRLLLWISWKYPAYPLRKIYWFIAFQYRKRVRGEPS